MTGQRQIQYYTILYYTMTGQRKITGGSRKGACCQIGIVYMGRRVMLLPPLTHLAQVAMHARTLCASKVWLKSPYSCSFQCMCASMQTCSNVARRYECMCEPPTRELMLAMCFSPFSQACLMDRTPNRFSDPGTCYRHAPGSHYLAAT
jgi:hypothetical protein